MIDFQFSTVRLATQNLLTWTAVILISSYSVVFVLENSFLCSLWCNTFSFLILFRVKQIVLSDINLEKIFQEFNTDQKTIHPFVGKSFEVAQTIKPFYGIFFVYLRILNFSQSTLHHYKNSVPSSLLDALGSRINVGKGGRRGEGGWNIR